MKYIVEKVESFVGKCKTVCLMIVCFWLIMFLVAGEHFL